MIFYFCRDLFFSERYFVFRTVSQTFYIFSVSNNYHRRSNQAETFQREAYFVGH
jgi:hypothetical protein